MQRGKYLNNICFKGDGEVFCRVAIYYPVWKKYEDKMEEIKREFPGIDIIVSKPEGRQAGKDN